MVAISRLHLDTPRHGVISPEHSGKGMDKTPDHAGRGLVYFATAISALGGMLFGYDIGVISGAILFIRTQFALSSLAEEIVVSAVLLGSLIGAAAGGTLADRFGRRRVLIGTGAWA